MSENSYRLSAPLVGFRTWYSRPLVSQRVFLEASPASYTPKPLALYPMTSEVPWTLGVNDATCRGEERQTSYKEPHTAPHSKCYCGLHAYIEPGHNHESQWIASLFDKELMVRGAVLMWGQIYGGKEVLRSEFAEIVGIIDESPVSKLIATKYKVPCVTEEHLIYLATEHGQPVSDELAQVIQERTERGALDYPKDFPEST